MNEQQTQAAESLRRESILRHAIWWLQFGYDPVTTRPPNQDERDAIAILKRLAKEVGAE